MDRAAFCKIFRWTNPNVLNVNLYESSELERFRQEKRRSEHCTVKKQGKMKIKTERGSKLGFGNTSQSKQVLYSSIFEKARGDFTAKG